MYQVPPQLASWDDDLSDPDLVGLPEDSSDDADGRHTCVCVPGRDFLGQVCSCPYGELE